MEKEGRIILMGTMMMAASLIADGVACRSRETAAEAFEAFPPYAVAWDVSQAAASSGVAFKVIKSEVLGRDAAQAFLWILVKSRTSDDGTRALAKAVIAEIRAVNPDVFSGFTLHFVEAPGLRRQAEESASFARATYYPDGTPEKIGRVPIDGYGSYKLVCEFR